ncbi:MAG TPA: trypsin-like peptidase domain-containing protein [Terriglobales bacterium]|nr:trypsin-like peptidase domain-containing protein [Terriglobales bacterium]
MKSIRPLLFAMALVGVFYWVTNRPVTRSTSGGSTPSWVTPPADIEVGHAAAPVALDSDEQNNVDVYRRVVPSVVNVTSKAVAWDFFYGPVPEEGQGSGFIIDKEGHILTNFHVISLNPRQIEVTLHDQKKYKAAVVGYDRTNDLALLQINAKDLPAIPIGDSANLLVGQKVYAIGNPFGLNGTMTRGIISSIRSVRSPSGAVIDKAIQTDAAINPGNSGGPLLNSKGEVIGINTFIATGQGGVEQSAGVGFAIPITSAKVFVEDLRQYGHVRRPSLGVRALPIGPELADEMGLAADSGLLIIYVTPGSSAERAGLRGGNKRAYLGNMEIMLGGDLIVAIDDKEMRSLQDYNDMMNRHRTGDTVTVTVFRGKQKMTFKVVLGEAQQTA